MADHGAEIAQYFKAVNSEDWSLLRSLWCVDAELRAVGARPRCGVEDVIAFYRNLFQSWEQHADTPTRILPSGDSATVEVTFTGTTKSDGQAVEFDAVDVFDFQDGLIARLTNWYDIAHVRSVLAGTDREIESP